MGRFDFVGDRPRDGRQARDAERQQRERFRREDEFPEVFLGGEFRGLTPAEEAAQNDPMREDPLVTRSMQSVRGELLGADPVDRVRATGEPGPAVEADPSTERQPDSLAEGELGLADGDVGLGVESELGLDDLDADLFD